jgi:hypothetical protein
VNINDAWQSDKPCKTHQELADLLRLSMDDPFTRVCIAAMYWRDKADYWKARAAIKKATD